MQGWFVVGDLLREQTVSVGADHDAVVVGFAGVDAGPQFGQNSLQSVGWVDPGRYPRRRVLIRRSCRVSQ